MSSRDARLLSRLLESLDTLENDAEIVLAVRKARQIAPGVFAGRNSISLAHADQQVAVKLRALGLVVARAVNELEPTMMPMDRFKAQVFAETCHALIEGGRVPLDHLLVVLSLLRDLLQPQLADPLPPRVVSRTGELRAAMEAVNDFIRR